MTPPRNDQGGNSFLLLVLLNVVALVAFAFSPHAGELPAAIVSMIAFILVQVLWRECRPNFQILLCPLNLALLFFWAQLVLLPLLIGLNGFALGTLPSLPSSGAINRALILNGGGFIAFCFAYRYFRIRHPQEGPETHGIGSRTLSTEGSAGVILVL